MLTFLCFQICELDCLPLENVLLFTYWSVCCHKLNFIVPEKHCPKSLQQRGRGRFKRYQDNERFTIRSRSPTESCYLALRGEVEATENNCRVLKIESRLTIFLLRSDMHKKIWTTFRSKFMRSIWCSWKTFDLLQKFYCGMYN